MFKGEYVRIVALQAIVLGFFGILIVLAGIALSTTDRWDVRCVDVLAGEPIPSDLGEPGMVLDILGPAVQVAETLGEIGRDQLREQIHGVIVQVRRVLDLATQDILIDLDCRSTVPEWSEPAQHFKDQDS